MARGKKRNQPAKPQAQAAEPPPGPVQQPVREQPPPAVQQPAAVVQPARVGDPPTALQPAQPEPEPADQAQPSLQRRVTFTEGHSTHHFAPSSSAGDVSHLSAEADWAGWWAAFKGAVAALKRDITALWYAAHDPRTPWWCRLLPLLVLAYALSPLDLIPDFIPVLGLLDDLLLLPLGLWLSCRLIPAHVMDDARLRAAREPLLLHRSWGVACLVAALWLGALLASAHWAVAAYGSEALQQGEPVLLAGCAALGVAAFAVWAVLAARHEARRRAQWDAAHAPLLSHDALAAIEEGSGA